MRYVLCIVIWCIGAANADASIRFESITLDKAIEKAKQENKLIFIDTYASWCAPCKVMDKVFAKQHIGEYFNDDFINVKIDMDGSQGPVMQNLYGVVWLPTLLIIDKSGEVLMKLDKIVTPGELIDYANEARNSRAAIADRGLRSNPFPQGTSASKKHEDYNPEDKEEVVYVYDERESSGRPHIMYHEAYLHLQLMDGKHERVVKKYLSTQKDWSTDKNVRFIFDFMDNVNSDLFQYFVSNRWRFDEVIGTEKVAENLGHLINQRIEQGYPRPELSEYIRLYKYLDATKGEQNAYHRYMDKMLAEEQQLPFINVASKYTKEVNPFDHKVMYRLAIAHLLADLYRKADNKNEAIQHLKSAVLYAPQDVKSTYEQELARLEGL